MTPRQRQVFSTLCSWIYLCTLRSAVLVCIYAVCDIDWKDSGTDRLEIKAGFYISNVSHNKGVYSPSLVKCIKNSMENANTDVGCKGLQLQMRPFPLIEKWFREKKIFLSGPRKKVINIWKGHKTNYTRGGSCWQSFRGHHVTVRFCINFENKFLFMTPRTILSANVSRGTKKKSDAFVIGGWTSWVMQIMVCSILSSILFLYTEPEIMEMIVCQFWARL